MTRTTPISEIMTSPVRTVAVDAKPSDVRRVPTRAGIHHVPVVDLLDDLCS